MASLPRPARHLCNHAAILTAPGLEPLEAQARNISAGGLCVQVPDHADPAALVGREFSVHLTPPFPARPVVARVVRAREGSRELGCVFTRFGTVRELAQAEIDKLVGSWLGLPTGQTKELGAEQAEAQGDYDRAAQLYEEAGLFEKAAAMLIAMVEHGDEKAQAPQKNKYCVPEIAAAPTCRYAKQHELGHGGMGVVYLATDTLLGRHVAYKVLAADFKSDAAAWERFVSEARAVAQLSHPGIVNIYDMGKDGDEHFMVLEYVQGANLKDMVIANGPFDPAEGARVLSDIARALGHAHQHGIVHGDVKPGNVMLSADGRVKLLDFGLARVLGDRSINLSRIIGTPQYLAPEQVRGSGIDWRVDIYSLGVTAFHLLTGELPFHGGDPAYHHLNTPTPSPAVRRPDLPPALCEAVLRCMAKDKLKRFQKAEDAAEAFERAV